MSDISSFYCVMGILSFIMTVMFILSVCQDETKKHIPKDQCPICEGRKVLYYYKIVKDSDGVEREKYIREDCIACKATGTRTWIDDIKVPLKFETDRFSLNQKYVIK